MTSPRYLDGCADGSQVRGDAAPLNPAARVVVWFDDGNVNNNNDNNRARARAVRVVGEFQGASLFQQLHAAYRRARRGKKPSANQLNFETHWADRLLDLERSITAGTWEPQPYTCFVATRPKAREIHAPDFGDRVVHHWLVAQLEPPFERRFADCSFANRTSRGTHAAVQRAQRYMREVQSGQGGGWYLQLDIANFFYSIRRDLLWDMLKRAMVRFGLPEQTQRAAHALLRRPADAHGVTYRSTAAQRALVPRHKQLANAAPGRGLPIGNLPSQFIANVYLDRLDQFVKHRLRAKRYLRYVDDFVLFHHDRDQLARWKDEIEAFLHRDLGLALKDDVRVRRLTDGLDFLGYVIHPTHTRVRRRVVAHANAALADWERAHVRRRHLQATPAELRGIRSTLASYEGHFRHADSFRLRRAIHRRYPWLQAATVGRRFHHSLEDRTLRIRRCP